MDSKDKSKYCPDFDVPEFSKQFHEEVFIHGIMKTLYNTAVYLRKLRTKVEGIDHAVRAIRPDFDFQPDNEYPVPNDMKGLVAYILEQANYVGGDIEVIELTLLGDKATESLPDAWGKHAN